jgi:hypothetical protein
MFPDISMIYREVDWGYLDPEILSFVLPNVGDYFRPIDMRLLRIFLH